MKKILCILISCILIFSLCGCLNVTISTGSNTSSSGSQQGSSGGSSAASQNADKSGYTITCLSSEGDAPVEGVQLQFCSDSKCMLGKTDADGMSVFNVPDGDYDVHIQSVPDGYYMPDGAEFKMTPDSKHQTVIIPVTGESSSLPAEDKSVSNSNLTLVPSANHGYLSGETYDLYGNPVDFATLFGSSKFTLMNIFKEGCGPCYSEFSELTELNERLHELGGKVVLVYDPGYTVNSYDDVRPGDITQILQDLDENGAKGMEVVIYVPAVTEAVGEEVNAYPTNFIVNSEAKIVSDDYPDYSDTSADSYYKWITSHLK